MSSDTDLMRKKRELELRRKMLKLQSNPPSQGAISRKDSQTRDSASLVKSVLVGRGSEVLEAARRHYPREMSELEARLADLIRTGKLAGPISGEELYSLLRRLGLIFSLDIKIRVSEHGRLKSLDEKLRDRRD